MFSLLSPKKKKLYQFLLQRQVGWSGAQQWSDFLQREKSAGRVVTLEHVNFWANINKP